MFYFMEGEKMEIIKRDFWIDEDELSERDETDMIVIHHTGGADIDPSAEDINGWHVNQGWVCIGYHYVICKDGSIEEGRPEWAVGSHAYGENSHTIGIHLGGDFSEAMPTDEQIESCAELIAHLCKKYDIEINRDNIVGHRDLMSTDCPGDNLYDLIPTIIQKANWYSGEDIKETNDVAEAIEKSQINVDDIAILTRKYESSGNPATVSTGYGDLGGISYGTYQFASNLGIVDKFVNWLCNYPDDDFANYGRVLKEHNVNSEEFISQWKELGEVDPGNFGMLQDEYVKSVYFDNAINRLRNNGLNIEKHSKALMNVVMSRAIQNGVGGCNELFAIVCNQMGHPNLSYIDDAYFDREIIEKIYDFLIEECDNAQEDDNGIYRSPNGFCNGSQGVINGLKNRFINEKQDAIDLL